MKKIITAVVATLAVAVSASAQVNFDKGVNVKSAVEQAVAAPIQLPEVKMGIPSYTTNDCKKVEFTAESPLTSPEISLRSMEMYQDCQNFGAPVGQICTPRPEYNNATTKVVITEPRVLQPGQKEVFEVCLNGPFLNLRPVSTVYKYSVKQDYEGFKLTPQAARSADKSASQADVCKLVMSASNTCTYQCKDGSYISRPNPFPGYPAPNPYVGPIPAGPCAPSISDIPSVTFGK